jgi:hypothetical protein
MKMKMKMKMKLDLDRHKSSLNKVMFLLLVLRQSDLFMTFVVVVVLRFKTKLFTSKSRNLDF